MNLVEICLNIITILMVSTSQLEQCSYIIISFVSLPYNLWFQQVSISTPRSGYWKFQGRRVAVKSQKHLKGSTSQNHPMTGPCHTKNGSARILEVALQWTPPGKRKPGQP